MANNPKRMKSTNMIRNLVYTICLCLALQVQVHALTMKSLGDVEIAEATQNAHNIQSWWSKQVVQADVQILFGGKPAVDGTFIFEAHGPRARYDRKDGVSIFFDGNTAWVYPPEAEAPKGRFHVLTWPWFIMAPFKMQGDGINLTEPSLRPMNGKNYLTLFQTFGDHMGDTPDDWYRFYINRKSNLVEGMSYIVTYGKDSEQANAQPSIILYKDYTDGDAPRISQTYELWLWSPKSGTTTGESPKATGQVSNISYLSAADVDFKVPEGARELQLPPQPINYSDYARLLDSYVTKTGVRYEDWFNNKNDLKALDDFLVELAEVDLSRYSEAEQKAFYINLYNAAMLQAVFKAYPTKSVKSVGLIPFSIFKKEFIDQNGRKLSLDDVEKGILLKDFFDPRIHFAVNCASESCPPLLNEPFTAAKLESQLEQQTRAFAISARAARVVMGKGRVEYSELFKWYDDDFEGDNPAEYLNRYRDMPLPLDLKVDWISYDWSLNNAE